MMRCTPSCSRRRARSSAGGIESRGDSPVNCSGSAGDRNGIIGMVAVAGVGAGRRGLEAPRFGVPAVMLDMDRLRVDGDDVEGGGALATGAPGVGAGGAHRQGAVDLP